MTLEELIAAVPIREFRGRPFYVRLRDIPPPWDAQFSRALYGSGCPYFEGEGDCAYSHDWERWVNSRSWGGAYAPAGLEPSQYQIQYVCDAVKAVYNVSPPGLLDIVVVALKCQGKFTDSDRELYEKILGRNVLDLVERCSAAAHQVTRSH